MDATLVLPQKVRQNILCCSLALVQTLEPEFAQLLTDIRHMHIIKFHAAISLFFSPIILMNLVTYHPKKYRLSRHENQSHHGDCVLKRHIFFFADIISPASPQDCPATCSQPEPRLTTSGKRWRRQPTAWRSVESVNTNPLWHKMI